MAAVSLFWDTNMAAVTSCENNLVPRALFKAREKRPGGENANKGHIYIKKTEVDNKLF